MNSIISLPRLIDLLSKASSKDKAMCEEFIRCFSDGIGDALGKSGNVRIKGFGIFNVVASGGVRRIVFIPDRELADAVNAPFACFEPVELAPGVSEEVLAAADDEMTDTVAGNIIYDSETEAFSQTVGAPVTQSHEAPESTEEDNNSTGSTPDDVHGSVDDTPAEQPDGGDGETMGKSGEIDKSASESASESVSTPESDDSIDDLPTATTDASDDLVIDFGFDVSFDIPGEGAEDNPISDSPEFAEDIPDEASEVPSSAVTEEMSDLDSYDDTAPEMPSDEVADQHVPFEDTEQPASYDGADETNSSEEPAEDEIEDLPPTPWAGKTKEDDGFTDTTGLGLLTPEARQRMLDRQNKSKDKERSGTSPWFWIAIAYIGGLAIGFMLGFFGHDYLKGLSDKDQTIDLTKAPISDDPDEEVIDLTGADDDLVGAQNVNPVEMLDSAEVKEQSDSVSSAMTDSVTTPRLGQPPVYDTITPNNNLNTLAYKHYGNRIYWVYIFLDNQDKIKDPNNVIVGTKLRIPPKEQYDVSDTDEKANIEAAYRKQSEIFTKNVKK